MFANVLDSSGVEKVSLNLAKVGNTAIDTNTGNASAGTPRVVLASNQPTLPVSMADATGSGNITAQNSNPNSGTATANSTIGLTSLGGKSIVSIQVSGTYTGALTPQVTVDGSNWVALSSLTNVATGVQSATIASASTGIWQANVSGFTAFRMSANAAVTGTATISLQSSIGPGVPTANLPISLRDAAGNMRGVNVNSSSQLSVSVDNNASAYGSSSVVSANFNRPADTTTYANADLVANNTTAGSVTPMTLSGAARANDTPFSIVRARLKKSTTTTTNAQFRVHFYSALPTVTNGDNAAWLSIHSSYIGFIDITIDKVFSDAASGIGVPNMGGQMIALPNTGGQNIYALIEARAAYAPGNAETFTLSIEVSRD